MLVTAPAPAPAHSDLFSSKHLVINRVWLIISKILFKAPERVFKKEETYVLQSKVP